MQSSLVFSAWWKNCDILAPRSKQKNFLHPIAGQLIFQTTALTFPDFSQLSLMVYTPADEAAQNKLLNGLVYTNEAR